ncbi:hypothetical protein RUND412_006177 [Rhizina undulata]
MPSRNNPNLPSALKRRARSRKPSVRKVIGTRAVIARTQPGEPVSKAGSGVHHRKTDSTKKERKKLRNREYAKQRALEMAADEMFKKTGEAEMKDISEVPLSKRQQKKAAQAAALATIKNTTANATNATTGSPAEVEVTMDVD